MNRIEAMRTFNTVLKTVRQYQAEMGAFFAAPMNFDESHGGGPVHTGNHRAEYVAWFAVCGKKALQPNPLLDARLDAGLSVRQLSIRSGVDSVTIRRAEQGGDVRLSSARFIAETLGRKVEDLFCQPTELERNIAYIIFREFHVAGKPEREVINTAAVSRATFEYYLDEIAAKVGQHLGTYGFVTRKLKNELIEEDLEAMGRR